METFSKLVKKLSFDLILARFGAKKGQKNGPRGPIFFTLLKVAPVSLRNKYHMNPVETFSNLVERLIFDLILAIFGAKNGQKKCPLGAHILLTS